MDLETFAPPRQSSGAGTPPAHVCELDLFPGPKFSQLEILFQVHPIQPIEIWSCLRGCWLLGSQGAPRRVAHLLDGSEWRWEGGLAVRATVPKQRGHAEVTGSAVSLEKAGN